MVISSSQVGVQSVELSVWIPADTLGAWILGSDGTVLNGGVDLRLGTVHSFIVCPVTCSGNLRTWHLQQKLCLFYWKQEFNSILSKS